MTTITVEIEKSKDLSAVKELITTLGLQYTVLKEIKQVYTEELKNTLDERYNAYTDGKIALVRAEESQQKIHQLLAAQGE